MDKKLLLVHIPKTGGNSIKEAIEVAWFGHAWPMHIKQVLGDEWNNYFKFAVIRHPADRFLSAYSYLIQQTPSHPWWESDKAEREYCLSFKSFEEFLFNSSPLRFLHFHKQSNWCIDLNKIYRYECLTELENDFNVKLKKINASQHDDWRKVYNNKMMERIRELYYSDFLLGY